MIGEEKRFFFSLFFTRFAGVRLYLTHFDDQEK